MTRLPATQRDSLPRLAAIALAVGVLCVASIVVTRATGRVALFGAANAFVLRLAMSRPAPAVAVQLLVVLIANVAANIATGDPLALAAGLGAANTFEVVLALVLLRAILGAHPFDITRWRSQLALAAVALVSPLASAPIAANLVGAGVEGRWWMADALGYLVFTPALSLVTIAGLRRLRAQHALEAVFGLSAVAAAVALSILWAPDHRLLPVLPFVVLVAFRLGIEGAALSPMAASVGGLIGVVLAPGPLADNAQHLVPLLQLGLFVSVTVSLPLGLVITRGRERDAVAAVRLAGEKARYDDLVDRIPVGVYRMRIDALGRTRFEFASPQLERMLHVPPGTLVRDPEPAFALAHPDDRPSLVAANQRAASTLEAFHWEGRFLPGGQERWFRIDSEPQRTEDGSVWHGVLSDITERQHERLELQTAKATIERETARYRSLLAIAHDGIHVIDANGRLVEANTAFLRSIGRAPEEVPQLTVADWDAHLAPEQIVPAIATLMDAPATFETRHRRSDGTTFDVEINAGGVTLDGQPYVLAASRDISHRKESERRLREVMAQLEQRVAEGVERAVASERAMIHQSRLAAMGEMIGNIAHQWRQPLNTLGMVLANLRDAQDDGRLSTAGLHDGVAQCGRLIRQMSDTISDFTEFFRPDKEPLTFLVRDQVVEAVDLVAASFRHHGIAVAIEGGAGLTSTGFPNEYSQVVLNLLSNARDAVTGRAPGDRRVAIEISSDGEWCRVTVSDNGGGVTLDPVERVFEPYVTTKVGGTGLGLYMSKMIVERSLGGRLTVANGPDGAAFTLTTPAGVR